MSRTLSEWHRRVALDIAQAFPLTPTTPVRASGNDLCAQNDEPAFEDDPLLFADADTPRASRRRGGFCSECHHQGGSHAHGCPEAM